jgi:hypothetical protein
MSAAASQSLHVPMALVARSSASYRWVYVSEIVAAKAPIDLFAYHID